MQQTEKVTGQIETLGGEESRERDVLIDAYGEKNGRSDTTFGKV